MGRLSEELSGVLDENRFVIGAGGLEEPGGGKIAILPNRMYFMGASSAPDHIFVTKADEEQIEYLKHPFEGKPLRVQTWIGRDLINKGSTRALAAYGHRMTKDERSSLQDLLNGGKGRPTKLSDIQYVYAKVEPAKGYEDQDLWYEAERYGNVGGFADKTTGKTVAYEIHLQRNQVPELKRNKKFKVVKVSKNSLS